MPARKTLGQLDRNLDAMSPDTEERGRQLIERGGPASDARHVLEKLEVLLH